MFYCIVNACLYIICLYGYFRKYKKIDSLFSIIALYGLVSCCGISYYTDGYSHPVEIQLWPFLYLFVTTLILFKPLANIKINYIRTSRSIELLVYVYTICCIVTLFGIWTDVVSHIISGDWQSVKMDAYKGYGNNGSRIIAYIGVIALFLRFLIYPYCFYCFTIKEKKFFKYFIILVLCVACNLFQYLMTAYRGGILSILFMLLLAFLIFRKKIPSNRLKFIYLVGTILVVAIMAINLSITNSRFENSKSGIGGSLMAYLGSSMVNFNGGIACSANSYMGGKYFFMSRLGLEKNSFWDDYKYHIYTHEGTDFDTLIGCFYIDFGPLLTFIICLLVSAIFTLLLKKGINKWSSFYILFFYFDLLVAGAFHGPSSLYQIIFDVVALFLLIKFVEIYERKCKRKNSRKLSQG